MKIKKVDDKPMVIHTKQKAKIHTHEPKQASIKGSNIYTVDRDPTKKKGAEGSHRITLGLRRWQSLLKVIQKKRKQLKKRQKLRI